MTITPDQARKLLDGATPGPWVKRCDQDGNPLPVVVSTSRGDRHHIMTADPAASPARQQADTDLIAAAPDLAQTVIDQAKRIEELEAQLAGVQWEYGVEQATGTTQWFRSRPMAEAHAEARGAFRLVRKPVGSVEDAE